MSNYNDVLNKLAAGEISADEAARQLRQPAAPQADLALAGRWLHVRVTDLATGKPKVNVNLPMSWVQVGLKIGAQHRPEIGQIDFAEVMSMIQAGASGRLVEVEDLEDGERVEVYVD